MFAGPTSVSPWIHHYVTALARSAIFPVHDLSLDHSSDPNTPPACAEEDAHNTGFSLG